MKLLTKATLYYSLLSIPLLVLAGIAFYYIIINQINESLDESLLNTRNQIGSYLNNNAVHHDFISPDGDSEFHYKEGVVTTKIIFRDTSIYSSEAHEFLPSRILISTYPVEGGYYEVKLKKAAIESDDLVEGIIASIVIIFIFLQGGLMGMNWWITKRLWKAFYNAVRYLKEYKIGEENKSIIVKSSINEFNDLNNSLNEMIEKAELDFKSQKEFTENASHEMQTPLAVMQSKIDLLIQSKNLGSDEMVLINSLVGSIKKLSHLNKSLLLLRKIENRQFKEVEHISLSEVVDNSLTLYENAIDEKRIKVTREYKNSLVLKMNKGLCEILISNLIQNAVRHNFDGGSITILIDNNYFNITNTGLPADKSIDMFQRFNKSDRSTDSIGLGLSIAKEIADASDLLLNYRYSDGKYSFLLSAE